MSPALQALTITMVPQARDLDVHGWQRLESSLEAALSSRPRGVRLQLALLVRLIETLAVVRYGRRLAALDPQRRAKLVARLQDAPLLLLRRGVWGLRTLLFLGYYGRAEGRIEIGYRADPRGWEVRR